MAEPDDETLAEAFWSVARRLRHLTGETLLPLGITPGQARSVSVLQRHGGMRLGDLAHHLRIAPRSATEVIDALEGQGLVARSPDPDDRRATLATLTETGEAVAKLLREARAQEGEAFFGRLDDADREALARILRTLRG